MRINVADRSEHVLAFVTGHTFRHFAASRIRRPANRHISVISVQSLSLSLSLSLSVQFSETNFCSCLVSIVLAYRFTFMVSRLHFVPKTCYHRSIPRILQWMGFTRAVIRSFPKWGRDRGLAWETEVHH